MSRANAVRARIARFVLAGAPEGASNAGRVGAFTLRPAQRDAVRLVHRAFEHYGGALLADPPGTGKTIIALAVARAFSDTLVVAPAALRAQWTLAAARAQVTIRFVSFETLSRSAAHTLDTCARLLVIDEAHHARTPTTRRYARLAELAVGARVLLLSATPVVNRPSDRAALLALFLGARADVITDSDASRVVIRRTDAQAPRPQTRVLAPLEVPNNLSGVAEALNSLPPPFPAADGAAALAILRLTLAMAWASSHAALDAALRRRVQRGEAMVDALAEGRWPDRAALRQWILGDDATQLAMPLLLPDSGRRPPAEAHALLMTHLSAVRALRASIAPHVSADAAARARAVLGLANAHPTRRLVLFAHHAETVRALWSALRTTPGVVAITGTQVLAAHGRWSREEVLRALGPRAEPLRRDDPRGIRILLTTDLLAEGVELQGVGIVVHGDSAWTPARYEQRVGRAVRIGGGRDVLVTRFAAPRGADALLSLARRLEQKSRARDSTLLPARAEEQLRERLLAWMRADVQAEAGASSDAGASPDAGASSNAVTSPAARQVDTEARLAAVRSWHHAPSNCHGGFLAAVVTAHGSQLLGGLRYTHRWRLTRRPRRLLALLTRSDGADEAVDERFARSAQRAITRWMRRRVVEASAGLAPVLEQGVGRRLQREVARAVEQSPLASRYTLASDAAETLGRIAHAPGVGTVRALASLRRECSTPSEFLSGLVGIGNALMAPPAAPQRVPRLVALLLLQAPPRPSAGSAKRPSRSESNLA